SPDSGSFLSEMVGISQKTGEGTVDLFTDPKKLAAEIERQDRDPYLTYNPAVAFANLGVKIGKSQEIDRRAAAYFESKGIETLPSENAWAIAGSAQLEGLRDSGVLLANKFTFGQIESLDKEAKRLIAE